MFKNIMNDTQKAFVDLVSKRRGNKLSDDNTIYRCFFR